MTFPSTKSARRTGRAALCAFAVLAAALVSTAAASAARGETGTIVVHQQGPGGAVVTGGCYTVTRTDGPDAGFWEERCDGHDDGGTDGVVVDNLPVGSYRLVEDIAPPGFKLGPAVFSATLTAGDTDTFTQVHQSLPPLRVASEDTSGQPVAGSCWRIHIPGEYEGYVAEKCDKDDGATDGTTTFKTITPGDYEIRHIAVLAPFHRLEDVSGFAMPDAEKTLTFTLERAVAPVNTMPPTVTGRAAVGEILSGDRGTWTGNFIGFTDSWQRCDAAGANCLTILNTNGKSRYTVTPADIDRTLRFAVAAKNEAARVAAVSAPVAVLSLDTPANTTRPTITGAVEPGQKLTGNPGAWTGAPTFAYRWQHCADDGTSCTDVANATGSTYTLTTGDAGFRIRLAVTGTNDAGSATAYSDPTGLPNDAPRNQERPTIQGNAEVGLQLTAYPGHWISFYGSMHFDYRWLRCDAADCVFIDGAESDVYTVRRADEGSRIRVEVTGSDAGGSATARSNPTLGVPSSRPVNTSPPYVVGDMVLKSKLVANAGVWVTNYGAIELEYRWNRCNSDGSGCVYLHTGRNHTVGSKDLGFSFVVYVYATNTKGTSMAYALTERVHEVPPVNVSPQGISGDAVNSERLTANPGQWIAPYGDTITVHYYWRRCDADGTSNCQFLHTGRTHDLEPKDEGHVMVVMFSVETDRGTAIVYAQTPVVVSAPPVNVSPQGISGDAVNSERLTANPGMWTSPYGDTIRVNYYWRRCDSAGNNCEYLHTGRTHDLESKDEGHVMVVMFSVETNHGVAIAYAQSPVVVSAPPVNVTFPPYIGGAPVNSERLTANPGGWASPYGDTIRVNYYWRRCDGDGTSNCQFLHTGRTHDLEPKDETHVMVVMFSIETDHGVAIAYAQTAVVRSSPPVNVSPQGISGDPVNSERLTANPGQWTSAWGDSIRVNYYWHRCDAAGANCVYLHTGRTHDLEPKDELHVMNVMFSVETAHGVAIAYAQTPVVHSAPPVNVSPQKISGDAVNGERLIANPGVWTSPYGDTIRFNYYWRRCDADGTTNCQYLHTGHTHDLEPKDEGHVMVVMFSVETDHGVAIAYAQTPVVVSAPPVNVLAPSINGTPRQGQTLFVNPGTWTSPYGDKIRFNFYWRRCDADGTSNCTYLHTGPNHRLGSDDVGHVMRVMLSVETDHGVTITYASSALVS